jgi:hypothetical protein
MILTTQPNFNNAVATSCLKYKSTWAIENLQSVGHAFIFQTGREWSLLIGFVRCLLDICVLYPNDEWRISAFT